MQNQFHPSKFVASTIASAILVMLPLASRPVYAASHEKVIVDFNVGNGEQPTGSLISDGAGNLYGTTSAGGANGYGNVFKLTPGANGVWTETVLHDFNRNGTDGANPQGALIFDQAGNLYGTASNGGDDENGAIFELSPAADGTWTEKVLFSFDGVNGSHPFGSLTFDKQGNLYATAWQGGNFSGRCIYGGCGTVVKLTPGANGVWTGAAIHVFNGTDGSAPFSNVIFDAAGNLYGTTSGVLSRQGYEATVFKLTPGSNADWTETVLYTFTQEHDTEIYSGLTFDQDGNLYGTTWSGPGPAAGSVFKLSPGTNGSWTSTILHAFNGKDGAFPYAGVTFDAAGNLWGTSSGYGSDLGSLFKLTPGSNGQWTIDVLQTFHDIQVDGGVLFDPAGNVYTTSFAGGIQTGCNVDQSGCGMVLEITP